ncbi:hypothetical protein J2T07_003025 [Luteibacter jiangsuensis]|uniref:Peptidoglycan-binding protein CsiV n=1 Tax=Luteibacter jiangsuensis TaxID=637577 RepID=A0ABT9T0M0_9GAMM|nr:hypothetical protein [Luteibacter jiangsuensis]MDQ0010819.1 hypothetical protein [Luteibacter jiangsuensis]
MGDMQGAAMKWTRLSAWLSLGLAACAQPTAAPSLQKEIAVTETERDEAAIRAEMNYRPVKWPLKFKRHNFGARCYDTLYCSIWYGGMESGDERPSVPSSTYGIDYLDNWNGGMSFDNFPPPAEVTWRSRDGLTHKTDIDVAAIFRDELMLHNVPREEISDVPDGRLRTNPSILLEVNDRTIRIYMRARIPTKRLQIPGNPYSDVRYDLILVKTYNY